MADGNLTLFPERSVLLCIALLIGQSFFPPEISAADSKPAFVFIRALKETRRADRPYMAPSIQEVRGSGVYIGNGSVLTDIEIVRNARSVFWRFGSSKKEQEAHVLFLGFDCGLALLSIKKQTTKDKELQGAKPPIFSGKLPDLDTTMDLYGHNAAGVLTKITVSPHMIATDLIDGSDIDYHKLIFLQPFQF